MSARIRFAARSEVGNVRTNNEDNLYCSGIFMTVSERERPFFLSGETEAPAIFAVFDGMGGEDCGEAASLTAAETLQEHSSRILKSCSGQAVSDYVSNTNNKLLGIMHSQGIRMGATLVMSVIGDNSFTIYNLGDSRGFRVEDGRLLRVTDDHTVAEDKMRMGLLTPAQADKSRERHILTRYLGDNDGFGVMPDASREFVFGANTGGLMCSDGLTDMLSFQEIAAIMKAAKSPAEAVNQLVLSALEHGGRDNVTCVVFEIQKEA
ncbi:MAG: serine/threonine-protein phosphatase [Synergistaceae bacterium]|nr:serine/threonine-protein phosphatase [Synergistaceae bacterium]